MIAADVYADNVYAFLAKRKIIKVLKLNSELNIVVFTCLQNISKRILKMVRFHKY